MANLDWLWWSAAGAMALVGLVLWLWAMFWDRSRGRKRCPKCWYDMEGTEARRQGGTEGEKEEKAQRHRGTKAQRAECWRCPECGKLITHERRMLKTRRRKRWVAVALVIGLGGGIGIPWWRAIERGGFWATVPTWVLIRIVDAQGWPENDDEKLQNGWSPASRELGNRYWMLGARTDAPHGLIDRSAYLCVRYRHIWPNHVPFRISLRSPPLAAIYGNSIRCRLFNENGAILVENEDLARSAFFSGPGPANVPWRDTTAPLPLDGTDARQREMFRLSIDASPAQWGEPLHSVFDDEIPIRVRLVDDLHDAIKPNTDKQLTVSLMSRLGLTVKWLEEDGKRTWFSGIIKSDRVAKQKPDLSSEFTDDRKSMYQLAHIMRSEYADTAFGIRIELMRGDEVIATSRCWLNPDQFDWRPYEEHSNRVHLVGDAESIDRVVLGDQGWHLRVSGDPEMALRDFDRDRYWSGSFVVPATEVSIEEVDDNWW